jgi:HD-GYP domain-containing protein (c-di-GMP phosphodiesterase class II)
VAIVAALCEAIDARPYMRGHGARVSLLAEAVAVRLGWGGERLLRMRVGARLHDLGKLAVADDLWDKRGRLTEREFGEIRRHPAAGARLLARHPDFRFTIPYVLFHHERWDGRGYPSGKAGHRIPLEARLLAIADAFDAMTSPRVYAPPIPTDDALAEIDRCAGTQFDPIVAGVFLELARETARPLLAADG